MNGSSFEKYDIFSTASNFLWSAYGWLFKFLYFRACICDLNQHFLSLEKNIKYCISVVATFLSWACDYCCDSHLMLVVSFEPTENNGNTTYILMLELWKNLKTPHCRCLPCYCTFHPLSVASKWRRMSL